MRRVRKDRGRRATHRQSPDAGQNSHCFAAQHRRFHVHGKSGGRTEGADTPRTALDGWTLALQHGGRLLAKWTWAEFEALPQTEITADIHCVTKWSKLDTRWRGVTIDDLIQAAGLTDAPAPFVLAYCDGGYTTNLPVNDVIQGKAMIATHFDGLPLLPSHGGPARLLVPHLYFWKSAKWVRRIAFRETDAPGFWESLGYHNHGDPWREQRYEGDR